MGHIESYSFIDPRVGDFGVLYSRRTLEEAKAVALKVGYSGKIQMDVIAYPPAPPRYEVSGLGDDPYIDDDGIPF